jgi:glycerol kinase
VQWLRDQLRAIPDAAASEAIAAALPSNRGVHLVPAFTGLGAPHWDPRARGAIVGLTRDSGTPEIVRAGLESVAYQVRELLDAMAADGVAPSELRVDGGMVANGWLMGFLAGLCGMPVRRPAVTETTALGAALLAGMHVGVYPPIDRVGEVWRAERDFTPAMAESERNGLMDGWRRALRRVQG